MTGRQTSCSGCDTTADSGMDGGRLAVRQNHMVPIDVDFATIRPWGRGQDTGFEELCCQIARAEALQRGRTFVRLGTPDGGVEGYSIEAGGGEHGLQAKFFLGSPSTDQWSKITSSVKTAIEKHPKLTAMTIALPSDRADPRRSGEQWFMDRWNHYVEQWETHAASLGRIVAFHYMGKSEILEALSHEEHAGRFRWWFERPLLSRTWLIERLDEAVEQVGPRYNRDLTVGVPAGRKIANFAGLPQLLIDLERHAASAGGHLERLDPAIAPGASAELRQLVTALPTPLTSGEAPTPDQQLPVDRWRRTWQALLATVRTLTTTVAAQRRGESDLVVGNLFGSNLFNSLAGGAVVGFATGPGTSSRASVAILAIMVLSSIIAWALLRRGLRLSRIEGLVLLVVYAAILPVVLIA